MTYAFLILLAVALLGALVLVALWKSTEVKLKAEAVAHDRTKLALATAEKGTEISEAARGDEKARLEQVVTNLKGELSQLEKAIDEKANPADVRARLRQLLGAEGSAVRPVPTPGGGIPPFGGVPK